MSPWSFSRSLIPAPENLGTSNLVRLGGTVQNRTKKMENNNKTTTRSWEMDIIVLCCFSCQHVIGFSVVGEPTSHKWCNGDKPGFMVENSDIFWHYIDPCWDKHVKLLLKSPWSFFAGEQALQYWFCLLLGWIIPGKDYLAPHVCCCTRHFSWQLAVTTMGLWC